MAIRRYQIGDHGQISGMGAKMVRVDGSNAGEKTPVRSDAYNHCDVESALSRRKRIRHCSLWEGQPFVGLIALAVVAKISCCKTKFFHHGRGVSLPVLSVPV